MGHGHDRRDRHREEELGQGADQQPAAAAVGPALAGLQQDLGDVQELGREGHAQQ